MKEYDALEAAYKNGFEAGCKIRDRRCGTWEWSDVMLLRYKPVYGYRCSECNEQVFARTPYCQYCGTKMNMEEYKHG